MHRTFTLDTNCLIDIELNRPAAAAVRMLADAHAAGRADVAVIAMSASENQNNGKLIQNFAEFEGYLAALNLSHLNIVMPMMYLDISFWDHCFWVDDAMLDLERRIHSILFPNQQFLWQEYCCDNGIIPPSSPPVGPWRNHKCDVQAIWSHIHGQRQVFVTRDRNFHRKKADLINYGAGRIEHPYEACSLL